MNSSEFSVMRSPAYEAGHGLSEAAGILNMVNARQEK
jgi:hypothetical protein